jgi:hypothetical protein
LTKFAGEPRRQCRSPKLAGEHHVGVALDAVNEALAAAVEVVEPRSGTLSLTLNAGAFSELSRIIA